jgi:hypothetical protein
MIADAAGTIVNIVGVVVVLAVAGGLWWGASKLEPHRVARDGQSFTCRSRSIVIDRNNNRAIAERWAEARVLFTDDGVRVVPRKRSAPAVDGAIVSTGNDGPRIRIYALNTDPLTEFRVPSRSKVIRHLDDRLRK